MKEALKQNDSDRIKQATDELNAAIQEIGQSMQNQQNAQQQEAPQQNAQENKQENLEDAEVEIVDENKEEKA